MQPIDSTDPFARPQDPSTHPLGGTATDPLAAGQDSTKQSPEKVPPANLFTFSPFGSLPPVKNNVNQSFGTLNGMAGGGGFGGASLFSSGSSNMGRPGASVGESDQMMGSKASTNDGRQSPRMGPHDGRLDLNLNQERRSPNLANDFYVGHATGGGNLGRLSPILGEHGRGGSPPPPPQQSMEEGKRKSIDDSWVALDWSDLRSSGETSPATDKAAHPLASIPELESKPPTSHKLSIPEGTVRPSFDAPPRSPMREGKEEMRREKSPVHHASVMMTTMAMREIKTLTPQKEPTVPTVPPTISHTPTARPTTDEKNGMEKSEKGTAEMATTTTKTDTPKAAPKAETPKATPKGDTSKATPKMETPKSAPTPATPRSSGRRRKSVDRLSPVPTERAESKAIEVPSGAGTKFGDIPHSNPSSSPLPAASDRVSSFQGVNEAQVGLSGADDPASFNLRTTRRGGQAQGPSASLQWFPSRCRSLVVCALVV